MDLEELNALFVDMGISLDMGTVEMIFTCGDTNNDGMLEVEVGTSGSCHFWRDSPPL